MKPLVFSILIVIFSSCQMDEKRADLNLLIEKIEGSDTVTTEQQYNAYFVVRGLHANDSLTEIKYWFNDNWQIPSYIDTAHVQFTTNRNYSTDTLFVKDYKISADIKTLKGLDTTLTSDIRIYIKGQNKDGELDE